MSYVTTIASTASPDEAKAFNELSNRREAAVLRRLAPLWQGLTARSLRRSGAPAKRQPLATYLPTAIAWPS
jgi:hypothetical protein